VIPPAAGSRNTVDIIPLPEGRPIRDLVAIGVSTGGPPAVQKVLSALPENFPVPLLVAQHMPASFTGPFAKRLDGLCRISVKEAESGEHLRAGCAYIAPGGRHIKLAMTVGKLVVVVTDDPKEALYRPSASVLMESVGLVLGHRALGVQMTGMGSDGLDGVYVLKQKGGVALAQRDSTCVVYGMPKAIVDAGLADEIVDLDNLAAAITRHLYT
jgi:two-component system chemotaxis response regulator CheB